MYRRVTAVLLALPVILALSPLTQAMEFKDKKTGKSETVLFTVGPDVGYWKYKEPDVMDEDGFQYGLFGKADYLYEKKFLFEVFMSYVRGDINYDGGYSDQTGHHDLSGDTPNWIFNTRVLAGYRIENAAPRKGAASKWVFTPYAGLAYRYLYNDLFSGDTGAPYRGYERKQSYWYLPLGLQAETPLANKWLFQARAEFDLFLRGRNESGDDEFTQDKGMGLRASGAWISPEHRTSGMKLNFMVEPYIEYWNIKESDVVNNMHEPDNNSYFLGVRGGVTF